MTNRRQVKKTRSGQSRCDVRRGSTPASDVMQFIDRFGCLCGEAENDFTILPGMPNESSTDGWFSGFIEFATFIRICAQIWHDFERKRWNAAMRNLAEQTRISNATDVSTPNAVPQSARRRQRKCSVWGLQRVARQLVGSCNAVFWG